MSDDEELIPTTLTLMVPGYEPESLEKEIPRDPGYAYLDMMLRPLLGGDLERVNVLVDGEYTDMFVDDVGQLKGLPRNEAATKIYRNNWLTHNPETDPESLPYIHGPAVLFSRKVWF